MLSKALLQEQTSFSRDGYRQFVSPNCLINFWAAAPIDRMAIFAGSGLPFPNPEVAYENTPNKGSVYASNGHSEIRLRFPNSFYVSMGTILLPPHVLLKFCKPKSLIHTVVLGKTISNKSLASLPGKYTRSNFATRQWDAEDLAQYSARNHLLDKCLDSSIWVTMFYLEGRHLCVIKTLVPELSTQQEVIMAH